MPDSMPDSPKGSRKATSRPTNNKPDIINGRPNGAWRRAVGAIGDVVD